MAKFKIDRNALSRFEKGRVPGEKKALELLEFASEDDAPLYCMPVLNEIEIPLSIAAFSKAQDFSPPINFLIHVDEHDPVIPAGRHAKLLSSYLMNSSSFDDLKLLWRGLIESRLAKYRNPDGTGYVDSDYRNAIKDGSEFFMRCLVFHEVAHEDEMTKLRPMLKAAGIEESELDIEP